MDLKRFLAKVKLKLRAKAVSRFRRAFFYPALYASWWHALLRKGGGAVPSRAYMAAVPHPGAGIGHQMANWIAGLWFANQFGLRHAHVPFSSREWERLLGFGAQTASMASLLDGGGYTCVRLQRFDESDASEVDRIRRIIASYGDRKVVFLLEQDQFYHDQFGVLAEIQRRFYSAPARQDDHLRYATDNLNIAIHVRRGDIVQSKKGANANLQMRWQDTQYFRDILSVALGHIKTGRHVRIYLFSQGNRNEFAEFEKLGDIEYCLDMDAYSSFLHMIHADVLITSKSSFSYKPALLSRGIKICPREFWHGYPDDEDWLLADEDGSLSPESRARLARLTEDRFSQDNPVPSAG